MGVYGEVPSGAVNGTNTIFTTAQTYAAGSTRVYVGGERQRLGVDYTESASRQLTFGAAPASGAVILVDYDLSANAGNTAVGTWDFSPEGYPSGAVMYYGPTLFPAGLDPTATKTAMFVLGPNGAQITVPPLAAGESGLPPVLALGDVSTLPAGSNVTASLPMSNPGGPGVASEYTLNLGIPQGEQGPAFETQIINASDLTGTPAAGYTLVYVPASGAVQAQMAYAAMPYSAVYNAIGIPDTNTNGGGNRTLQPITIPAKPFMWVPDVRAQGTITGTASTRVNLVARLNNGSSGNFSGTQVAVGEGLLGAGPQILSTAMAFTSGVSGGTGSPVIPANTSVTILVNAEQQAATTDEYSTSNVTASVVCIPVGIIPQAGVVADVVGPTGLSVSSNTGSFSNTIGAGDDYVIVAVAGASTTNLLGMTISATYGGVAMTSLGGANDANTNAFVQLFGLQNPPAGAQTVVVTGPSGSGGVTGLVANAVSFQYWNQTSWPSLTSGTSAALSANPVQLSASQIALCAMVSYGSSPITPGAAVGSALWSKTLGSLQFVLLAADGTGSTVQLTGSTSGSQPWGAVQVTLI